jgi:hypothetical protein
MTDILTIAKLTILAGLALMALAAMLGRPRTKCRLPLVGKPPKYTVHTSPPYRPKYRLPGADPAAFPRAAGDAAAYRDECP